MSSEMFLVLQFFFLVIGAAAVFYFYKIAKKATPIFFLALLFALIGAIGIGNYGNLQPIPTYDEGLANAGVFIENAEKYHSLSEVAGVALVYFLGVVSILFGIFVFLLGDSRHRRNERRKLQQRRESFCRVLSD